MWGSSEATPHLTGNYLLSCWQQAYKEDAFFISDIAAHNQSTPHYGPSMFQRLGAMWVNLTLLFLLNGRGRNILMLRTKTFGHGNGPCTVVICHRTYTRWTFGLLDGVPGILLTDSVMIVFILCNIYKIIS